jgi:hypothetical protein
MALAQHKLSTGTHALLGDFVLKTAPVLEHRSAWFQTEP